MKNFIILFILLWFSPAAFSQNTDISILRKINHNNGSFDPAFRLFTSSVVPLSLIVPAGFITAYILNKDSANKSNAIFICSSLIVSGVLTTTLKYSINRQRPFTTYKDIEKKTSAVGPSFPSGHTSEAFALATSVSIICPKWYIIVPSFAWASAVAYSRMDLGAHYPSDVLAGAILGSGSAILSYKINRWLASPKSKSH